MIDRFIKENNINMDKITSIGLGCPGGIDKNNVIFLGSSNLNAKEIDWRKELMNPKKESMKEEKYLKV